MTGLRLVGGQRGQRHAQPTHRGGGRQAVTHHVPDADPQAIVAQPERVIPVTADLEHVAAGLVARGDLDSGVLDQSVGQERPLKTQGDRVLLLAQLRRAEIDLEARPHLLHELRVLKDPALVGIGEAQHQRAAVPGADAQGQGHLVGGRLTGRRPDRLPGREPPQVTVGVGGLEPRVVGGADRQDLDQAPKAAIQALLALELGQQFGQQGGASMGLAFVLLAHQPLLLGLPDVRDVDRRSGDRLGHRRVTGERGAAEDRQPALASIPAHDPDLLVEPSVSRRIQRPPHRLRIAGAILLDDHPIQGFRQGQRVLGLQAEHPAHAGVGLGTILVHIPDEAPHRGSIERDLGADLGLTHRGLGPHPLDGGPGLVGHRLDQPHVIDREGSWPPVVDE